MLDMVIKQLYAVPLIVQVPANPAQADAVDRLDFSDMPVSVVTLPDG